MSKDQAAMKRQASRQELSGGRTHEGVVPSSWKTGNSVNHSLHEERTSPKRGGEAPMISGVVHLEYASASQFPEVIPFKVKEDV